MKIPTTRTKIATAGLYAVGLVLCLGISKFMWQRVEDSVNKSYKSYAFDPQSSLAQRLNNANTYYWYARYRKNSQPEFERSLAIAQEILKEISDSLKAYPDRTIQYQTIQTQAQTLANYCKEQSEVSQLNIASYVPMYLEMMAHDEAFMEQDCDDAEVETRAANRAIDVLLELISPEKNAKISERPLFALVQAIGEPKAIHESIIQKLNAESKFYTISDHELVKILGPGATYQNVFNDSAALVDVARFYGAKSIALIDLVNNDQVDGIHYFGMRYSIWQQGENSIKDGVYTEYFVRNRNFNQMTIMKIPLFIGYMGIIGAVGFIIALALLGLNSLKFTWYSLWITISGALVTVIATIDYLFMEFLNPLPSDYYATDAGEIWQISLPLVLIALPVFINYVILGRLDKHISSFKSKLDEPSGLFALIAGSLAVIPLIWVNYRLMRFGVETQTLATTLYAMVLYLTYGFGLSRWMHKIIDFPQKVDWRRRALAYSILGALTYLTYGTTAELIIGSTTAVNWLNVALVITLPLLLEQLYRVIPLQNALAIAVDEPRPVNIEQLQLVNMKWSFNDKTSSFLRVQASKSLNASKFLAIDRGSNDLDWHVIDFSQRGDGKVHYFPYAKAFEHLFTYKRFNDVAEQSRIIGNLLGKLVSTISSVGDYLIDESEPKPRNVKEVAAMIVDALATKDFGLIFQHPELAIEEDLELFEAILGKVIALERIPPIAFCEGSAYSLQLRFNSVFNQFSTQLGNEPVVFEITFKNLAQSLLYNRGIEPLSRVLIEEKLISSELDQTPTLAQQAIDDLLNSPQVFKNRFNKIQLKSYQFEFSAQFNKNEDLEGLIRPVRAVLDCAAIAANEVGIFNLDLVIAIAGLPRMEVLEHLDSLQSEHLVIDLQDDDHADQFQFSDIETIKLLRQEDEHERPNLSQQLREHYRAYIKFFLPYEDWSKSEPHLLECIKNKLISERELTFLAFRALRVGGINYLEDLINFVLAKTISEGLSANFDRARQVIELYRKTVKTDSERIDWHEFVLLVETGEAIKAKGLFNNRIRAKVEQCVLSPSDLLVCVRYCFGDFNPENAALGTNIIDSILKDSQPDIYDRLRGKFYTSKFIPNKAKNFESADNAQNIIIVRNTYEELLVELNSVLGTEKNNYKGISLLKEVLNDYIGFLADYVWPSKNAIPNSDYDLDESIVRFEELKVRRIGLEPTGEGMENWLDPSWVKRGTPIDYRGFCYTYNYIQRGYEALGKYRESIEVGHMSFTLNSFVGDHNGKQVCAGTLSKAYVKSGKFDEGLYWAEQSLAYAHLHNLYTMNARKVLAECPDEGNNAYRQLSHMLTNRHMVKHYDQAMPLADKKSLLLDNKALLKANSEEGSRFYWAKPMNDVFLDKLVEKLRTATNLEEGQSVKVEDTDVRIGKVRRVQINDKDPKELKIDIELTFPTVIGECYVIPIKGHTALKGRRHGTLDDVWMIHGIEPQKTNQCVLCVHTFKEGLPWFINTAYPGVWAPPLPNPRQNTLEHEESIAFWDQHAFIATKEDTKALTSVSQLS
jgi:hypothetical protein